LKFQEHVTFLFSVLREATAEARTSIPLLHSKLSSLSEENSSLRSHMLSMSLASESAFQDEISEEKDHVQQIQNQVQEKSMQLAVLQQAHELQLKSAQDTIDQQNAELQRIRDLSVRSTDTLISASHLPVLAARFRGMLGSLKGQVISLRNSYNDEIQALWVCMGKSMEAILSIANAESSRSRTQIIQLQHDITTLGSRNSELESAMSKDAAVYEAAEAALIFERVRWETRTLELRESLEKAENSVSSLNASVNGLKESLKAVNAALLAQQLRMAGVLSTLCPLFLPNDHVLSTLTDGLCTNIFVLRMCCRICSEHNPEFSAALLTHFDFAPSDSLGASANQASEFHESSLKLRQASVGPTITLSLQLLYSGIMEAIRSKSQLTSDFEARLQSSAATTSTLQVRPPQTVYLSLYIMLSSMHFRPKTYV
jgi:predicted  nucleic acid-binding Zn-ribbon protein